MSDLNSASTPVGARPATGGRVREYADGVERARAWRERQRARRVEAGQPPTVGSPALAEASLAVVMEQLRTLLQSHRDEVAGLVGRAEEAIDLLGDPEAVAEALESGRAEAARQVAEAQEQVARANQLRSAAEGAARQAKAEQEEAEGAATVAWERVDQLETEVAGLRGDLQRLEEEGARQAAAHAEALAGVQAEAEAQVGAARREAEVLVGEAGEARARAEGRAEAAQRELEALRAEADRRVAAVREEAATRLSAAQSELTERLDERHASELAAAEARAAAALARANEEAAGERARAAEAHARELARAEARAEGASELADARRAEVERLASQVEDLRADLGRLRSGEAAGGAPGEKPRPARRPRRGERGRGVELEARIYLAGSWVWTPTRLASRRRAWRPERLRSTPRDRSQRRMVVTLTL